MNINELIKKAHDNAVNKGFYSNGGQEYCTDCKSFLTCKKEYKEPAGYCDYFVTKDKNIGELLMLIVSELGEALEAHRKGKHSVKFDVFENDNSCLWDFTKKDDIEYFRGNIKDTFEDELADACIRIFDLCGYLNIDLEKHIELKMKYNETREYKHGKRY